MARVEITYPGTVITDEFTALVAQPTVPSTAKPVDVGLVEISLPSELIPGPAGPGVIVSDTPPPDPVDGNLWWESDTGTLWAWYVDADSGQWVQISGGNSLAAVVVSDTPPGEPLLSGQLWWNSTSGNLYCWYEDADSGQWVQVNTTGGQRVSVRDFGGVGDGVHDDTAAVTDGTAAVSAAGGGVLWFPAGDWNYTYTQPTQTNVVWEFDGPLTNWADIGGFDVADFKTVKFGVMDGPHPTRRMTFEGISAIAEGSGVNGPAAADFASEIIMTKKDWRTPSAAAGEIDGQWITVQQGGPATGEKSAVGGQVIGVQAIHGAGFAAMFENLTTIFSRSDFTTKLYEIRMQGGAINTRAGEETYYGLTLDANVGALDAALLIRNVASGTWADVLRVQKAGQGWYAYSVDTSGKQTWNLNGTIKASFGAETDGRLVARDSTGLNLFSILPTGVVQLAATSGGPGTRNVQVVAGTPEGVVSGNIGDLCIRHDGTAHTGIYRKTTNSSNTGWQALQERIASTTAARPTGLNAAHIGVEVFDTTLGKPVWWKGAVWVDATGATV